MRTTSFLVAGAFVVGVVVATTAASRSARVGTAATVTVAVDPRCPVGPDTLAIIKPWNVTVAQGDSLQWTVSANGSATAITIVPKNRQGWPFASNRASGNRQMPAAASGMRGNAKGRYSYSVEYICRAGTPTADTVRIDPDVIVE